MEEEQQIQLSGPAWVTEAVELWLQGWTDQRIAEAVGVTRARVAKVLADNAPAMPSRPWVPIEHLRALASTGVIRRWIKESRVRQSEGSKLVHAGEVVAEATRLRLRQCQGPGCKRKIGTLNEAQHLCSVCSIERDRYNYPYMSQAQREAKRAAQRRKWVEQKEQKE